jgi:small multidrug resistance pump
MRYEVGFTEENAVGYLYLSVAIVAEVVATSALKASDGFTKPVPSIIVVLGYGLAFFCLSLVLKVIPVGIAYAIWAGMGVVLVAVVAAIAFKQMPDWPAIAGMLLIISGVVVINAFSKTVGH